MEGKIKNCSKCWKCLRTLVTMKIVGLIYRYADSFDLEEYVKHKNRYLGYLLSSNQTLDREVIEFAKKEKYFFHISHTYIWFFIK